MLVMSTGGPPIMTASTQEKLNKIRAQIIKLQTKADCSDFESEQQIFAQKVRELMEKYEISSTDLETPVADDSAFGDTFKRLDSAYMSLLNGVAKYYGAELYWGSVFEPKTREWVQQFKLIGTEGQRIETELYFEFLLNHMNSEAEKAYKEEKKNAKLTNSNKKFHGWKQNFRKAMAQTIEYRLHEMKQENNPVSEADANAVAIVLATKKIVSHRDTAAQGSAAANGRSAGLSASLNRQAGAAGRGGRALAGY